MKRARRFGGGGQKPVNLGHLNFNPFDLDHFRSQEVEQEVKQNDQFNACFYIWNKHILPVEQTNSHHLKGLEFGHKCVLKLDTS